MNETVEFLTALFEYKPEDSYLLLYALPEKESYWTRQIEKAARKAMDWKATQNVYVGVGLSPQSYGPHHRCAAGEIVGIPGYWADLDLAGPAHKKPNLPGTVDDIEELLEASGLTPTVRVDSGHGVQVYWLFKEPWIFTVAEERAAAARGAEAWTRTLREHAKRRGWDVDGTFDLARVMRLPGTVNHKGPETREVRLL